jgi:twitching motility protein PilT
MEPILDFAIQAGASDIHILPNSYPILRLNGEIVQLKNMPIITKEEAQIMVYGILNDEQKEMFIASKEYDFSYSYKENRLRFNVYNTYEGVSAAGRLIPGHIKTLEELELPNNLYVLGEYNDGLVIVNGQTGQGKSSTIAAILDHINKTYSRHVITIEDPIEYIYQKDKSVFSQRELNVNTHSWNIALKSAMREDPDIVMIGEMRDVETMQAALTLAETGHLVFTTLHTTTAAEGVNRIIDQFPAHQQDQIRYQVSSVLKTSISQKLVLNIQNRQIPALEILHNTPAVANSIRESKVHLIDNLIITGENEGMILFEKYLYSLVNKGIISETTALNSAFRLDYMKRLLKI